MKRLWFKKSIYRKMLALKEKIKETNKITYVVYAELRPLTFEPTGRTTTTLFQFPNSEIIGSIENKDDVEGMKKLWHNYYFPLFPI